jgi:hypothetical protein
MKKNIRIQITPTANGFSVIDERPSRTPGCDIYGKRVNEISFDSKAKMMAFIDKIYDNPKSATKLIEEDLVTE